MRDCQLGNRNLLRAVEWVGLMWVVAALVAGTWQPVGAGNSLPPRPSLTPTPAPTSTPVVGEQGAHIVLQAVGAPRAAWTVVQWQDASGLWRDVEGWRGEVMQGRQRWWVAAKDLGTGPFRWLVMDGRDGPLWGVSQPFTLPTQSGAILHVAVSASP